MLPRTAEEILFPKYKDGRPMVWDEDGVPLNSDVQDLSMRPNRDKRDYMAVPDLITWPKKQGPSWTNTALMHRIVPAVPDMLSTTLEATRAYREVAGKEDEPLTPVEGLIVVDGLQKAWSLLMYGNNRLPNGQLPRHFAGLQRVLLGHVGKLMHEAAEGPLNLIFGAYNNEPIDVDRFTNEIFADGNLTNEQTNEHCPASRAIHVAMNDCLFTPPDIAAKKHRDVWLQKANPDRTLSNYGIVPEAISLLGVVSSQMLLDPLSIGERGDDLLRTHRYLVGDITLEDTEAYLDQTIT
jgi:hypothetical protein